MASQTARESRRHPVKYAKGRFKEPRLGLFSLTALVVGGVIGSGIFNLMKEMAVGSPFAVIIAWIIAGVGMGALAYSFYNLNKKRPELEAGVYSYAEAGFGKFMGFNSAWGYWISAWIGNVAYATITFSALGYFFNVFGDGTNWPSVIGASVGLWLVAALILSGIKNASFMNILVTIAKFVPLLVFLVAVAFAFKFNMFSADFWGTIRSSGGGFQFSELMTQVKGTMLATVFVFIGIEGAVVLSGRAEKAKNVGKATALGFLITLSLFFLITVLSFGVMSQSQLAGLGEPAMASVLESVVGKWGAILINIGVIVSVTGAWLAWTLFSLELPYRAAKQGVFPKLFALETKKNVPWASLLITTILVQIFIFSFLISSSPYNLMFSLCASTILIPYLFSAGFQLKESWKEKRGVKGRGLNLTVGIVAVVYAIWLLYAGGVGYLLSMVILYAIGVPFYIWARRNSGAKKTFKPWEMIVAVVMILVAIYGVYWMAFQGGYTALVG